VYYLEAVPVAAALVGLGAWTIARRFAQQRSTTALVAAAGFTVAVGVFAAIEARRQRLASRVFNQQRQITGVLPRLPSPGILFVRYSPKLSPNPALVRNSANLEAERMWIVHDLGPRNDELRRSAPQRATHSLDLDRMMRGRR
jgi:hypothetical protein